MSETFTKLFSSITDSTIWTEPDTTRLVWITMLAMADRHGYVGASIPGLAARARVDVTAVEVALSKFLGPDPYSRSQDFEGRRIEAADRGWNILNYERFRDMRDEEARKEYERTRKRRARAKAQMSRTVPGLSRVSRDVPAIPPLSAQAEADSDAEANAEDPPNPPAAGRRRWPEQETVDQPPAGTAGPQSPVNQFRGRQSKRRTVAANGQPPEGRSRLPIFKGERLVVFEWQFDDLTRMLGSNTAAFDLDQWFYALDARAVASSCVIPQRDGGAWLQSQTLAEAQRRGLPIAVTASPPPVRKLTSRLAAAVEDIRREEAQS